MCTLTVQIATVPLSCSDCLSLRERRHHDSLLSGQEPQPYQHTCGLFIPSQQFCFFKTECIISCFSIKKFLYLRCQSGFGLEAYSRVVQNQQLEAVWTCLLKSAVILYKQTNNAWVASQSILLPQTTSLISGERTT